MARQRINPEPAPDRIVQPVARPVDTYVQPDVASFMSVSRAFAEMVPGLQNLGNSMIDAIAEREAFEGAVEGKNLSQMPQGPDKQAQTAKAIERAGGISPWRAQSTLKTLGANSAMQGYAAELDKKFEDLSNPFGPDGAPRDPNYAASQMQQVWSEFSKGLPNSYYARAGAEEVRAKYDAQYIDQVNAKAADKIKSTHVEASANKIVGILNNSNTIDDVLARGSELDQAYQEYYQATGESFDKFLPKALSLWAVAEAEDDNGASPSQVRDILERIREQGIGDRKLNEMAKLDISKLIDQVDDSIERNSSDAKARQDRIFTSTSRRIVTDLQTKSDNGQALPERGGLEEYVDAQMDAAGVPVDMRLEMKGLLMDQVRGFSENLRKPPEISDQDRMAWFNKVRTSTDPWAVVKEAESGVANGAVPFSLYQSVVEVAQARTTMSREAQADLKTTINEQVSNGRWTGRSPNVLSPEGYSDLSQIEQAVDAEINSRFEAALSSPEGLAASSNPNPTVFSSWQRETLRKISTEVLEKARKDNQATIDRWDRSKSYTEIAAPFVEKNMDIFIAQLMPDGPENSTVEEFYYKRLVLAAAKEYHDQVGGDSIAIGNAFVSGVAMNWIHNRVREMQSDPAALSGVLGDANAESMMYRPKAAFIPRNPLTGLPESVTAASDNAATFGGTAVQSLADGLRATRQVYNMNGWLSDRGRFLSKYDKLSAAATKLKTANATPEDRVAFIKAQESLQNEAQWTLYQGLNDGQNYRITENGVERRGMLIPASGPQSGNLVMAWLRDPQASNLMLGALKTTGITLEDIQGGNGRAPMTTVHGYRLQPKDLDPATTPMFLSVEHYEAAVADGRMMQTWEALRDMGYTLSPQEFQKQQATLVYSLFPKKTQAQTK